jgi:hypothetical protein
VEIVTPASVAASDASVFTLFGECSELAPLRLLEYPAQDADPIDRQLMVEKQLGTTDEKLVVTRANKVFVLGIRAAKLVTAPMIDGNLVPAESVPASRLLAALASGDTVWALVVDPTGKHSVVRDGAPVAVDLAPSAIGYDETLGAVILATDGKQSRLYAERALTR